MFKLKDSNNMHHYKVNSYHRDPKQCWAKSSLHNSSWYSLRTSWSDEASLGTSKGEDSQVMTWGSAFLARKTQGICLAFISIKNNAAMCLCRLFQSTHCSSTGQKLKSFPCGLCWSRKDLPRNIRMWNKNGPRHKETPSQKEVPSQKEL